MKEFPIIIVNGQTQQNSISVSDRGLAYGDGVFETMHVVQGDIVLWQYHYARLCLGLQRLYIDVDNDELVQHIAVSIQAIHDQPLQCGVLKLIITRGIGQRGYMPSDENKASLITIFTPLNDSFFTDNQTHQRDGVAVHYCSERLAISASLAGIKSLNQLPYVLASRERQSLSVQEGLLLDDMGHLVEATARNLFIVKDGILYTPMLNRCGVAGVMRRFIMEYIAVEHNLTVKETTLTTTMLEQSDEVFLCNSVSGIWPVIQCDQQQWPIGEVTQHIQYALNQFTVTVKHLSLSHFLSSKVM